MTLSPPMTIIALLAVGVAGVTWYAPPEVGPKYVAVHVSVATFDKLKHWAKDHPGASGQPMTMEQVIDVLADEATTDAPRAKE